MLDVVHRHEGLVNDAQDRLGLRRIDALGREPVDHAGAAVEIPFARRVDLAEDIHGVVPLVLAVAVLGVRPGQREGPGVRIDGGHLLILLVPVPEPIAVEADVRLVEPAARAVLDVLELAVLAALDRVPHGEGVRAQDLAGLDETLVRPAGERLRDAIHEQLRPAAQRRRVAQIGHAQRLHIRLKNAVANRRIELVAQFRICDRLPSGDSHSAAEDGRLAGLRLVDHRGLGRSRILGCQRQRPLDGIRRRRRSGFARRPWEAHRHAISSTPARHPAPSPESGTAWPRSHRPHRSPSATRGTRRQARAATATALGRQRDRGRASPAFDAPPRRGSDAPCPDRTAAPSHQPPDAAMSLSQRQNPGEPGAVSARPKPGQAANERRG